MGGWAFRCPSLRYFLLVNILDTSVKTTSVAFPTKWLTLTTKLVS